MKKIANIVSEVDIFNHKKVDWINYVQKPTECNLNIPTLIIGWNNYKKTFPHLFQNILSKKSVSQYPLWWEFSMDEKITDHFTGIEEFIKNAPREYINLYKYTSIDPIKNNIRDVEHLYKSLGLALGTYYQYKNEIIYVHNKLENNIIGIYLNSFKYFGFDINEITSLFSNNFKTKVIDTDGTLYQSYYKQFPDFDQLKRTMVLFLV